MWRSKGRSVRGRRLRQPGAANATNGLCHRVAGDHSWAPLGSLTGCSWPPGLTAHRFPIRDRPSWRNGVPDRNAEHAPLRRPVSPLASRTLDGGPGWPHRLVAAVTGQHHETSGGGCARCIDTAPASPELAPLKGSQNEPLRSRPPDPVPLRRRIQEKSFCALIKMSRIGKRRVLADIDARWPIEYIRDIGHDRTDRGAGTGAEQVGAAEGCDPWFLPQRASPSSSIP